MILIFGGTAVGVCVNQSLTSNNEYGEGNSLKKIKKVRVENYPQLGVNSQPNMHILGLPTYF